MFFGGDPFEHFAHAGAGGPGGGRPRKDVDTTKLYQTLGVSKCKTKNDQIEFNIIISLISNS